MSSAEGLWKRAIAFVNGKGEMYPRDVIPYKDSRRLTGEESDIVDQIFKTLLYLRKTVAKGQQLVPSKRLDLELKALVDTCVQPRHDDSVEEIYKQFSEEERKELRGLCGTAEGLLEQTEGEKIWMILTANVGKAEKHTERSALGPQPINPINKAILKTFPYYKNYSKLAKMEYGMILPFLDDYKKNCVVAFVGSGPLPMSAICLSKHMANAKFVLIDRDEQAVSISRNLIDYLYARDVDRRIVAANIVQGEIPGVMDVPQGIVFNGPGWASFGVVFLASLVGEDSINKMHILKYIRGKVCPGTLVVVRSAWGLRRLLYPVLELSPPDLLEIGYEVLSVMHPHNEVVNSVVVLRAHDFHEDY